MFFGLKFYSLKMREWYGEQRSGVLYGKLFFNRFRLIAVTAIGYWLGFRNIKMPPII